MANLFVGPGGSDSNNGTSWALRKLTLNGVEAIVAAGDTVYVGPGTYKEELTLTTSGSSGNIITYIADVRGDMTDGKGGVVRITGSDDGYTIIRDRAIVATSINYRTFRGFLCDSTDLQVILFTGCTNIVIEEIDVYALDSITAIHLNTPTASIVRKCRTFSGQNFDSRGIFIEGSFTNATTSVVNCECVVGRFARGIYFYGVNDVVCDHNYVLGGSESIYAQFCNAGSITNCLVMNATDPFQGFGSDDVVLDYCGYWNCSNAITTNLDVGSNNVNYPIVFKPFLRLGDGNIVGSPSQLVDDSFYRGYATGSLAEDLWGHPRPTGNGSDLGAVESNAFVNAAAGNAIEVLGRGMIDFEVLCEAGNTVTITCDVEWDDNTNIGVKPSIKILAGFGETEQVDNATGTGGGETLTVSATPTTTYDAVFIVSLINNSTYSSLISARFSNIDVSYS